MNDESLLGNFIVLGEDIKEISYFVLSSAQLSGHLVWACVCGRAPWTWHPFTWTHWERVWRTVLCIHFIIAWRRWERFLIKHCADWKHSAFSSMGCAADGLGWSEEQKTAVCFAQKSPSAEPESKPGEVDSPSRAVLPGDVKFKRAGEGTGGSLEVCCAGFGGRCFSRKGRSPWSRRLCPKKRMPLSRAGFWSPFSILFPEAHKEARLCDDRHCAGLGRQHRS